MVSCLFSDSFPLQIASSLIIHLIDKNMFDIMKSRNKGQFGNSAVWKWMHIWRPFASFILLQLCKKIGHKKLPWLKYDMKKAEYLEAKELEKDAKKKLDEAAKMLNELKEPIENQKQEKKGHGLKCRRYRDLLDNTDTSHKQMIEKGNQLGAKVKGKYSDMDELEKQEQSRQERIGKAEKDLADTEMQLENLPVFQPPKDKIVIYASFTYFILFFLQLFH
ncbi:hypothetical protein LXL04_023466 [Taraxacum kok-saghyz]